MSARRRFLTSESVAAGHPDKVADRISDEVLDRCLGVNPRARVAVETLVTDRLCVVAGETSGAAIDYERVAREAIGSVGYREGRFSPAVPVLVRVHEQAAEIAHALEGEGAGDQGMMFGYACRETPELMPAPIALAHRIAEAASRLEGLGPDGKSQVSLEYEGDRPVRLEAAVVSMMHRRDLSLDVVHARVAGVVARLVPEEWWDERTRLYVNPGGSFVEGGPATDTGLTGRKIIVDTYGGAVPHGGGAFSGKDATKVDRSGAYAARYLAKNVVAAGLAERCLVQLAYAIGVAEPIALHVDCGGTAKRDERWLEDELRSRVPLSSASIRRRFGLDRPIFARTACFGHFGRPPEDDGGFAWERTDLAQSLARDA